MRVQIVRSTRPVYVISVAAEICGLHPRTLRIYEEKGLLQPARRNRIRLYSERDIERVRLIRQLIEHHRLNLAGVRLDAVIAECTKAFVDAPYDTHLGLSDVLRLKERLLVMGTAHAETRWAVTHFSHNGRPLQEELEAFCQPHEIEVAYDGWVMAL